MVKRDFYAILGVPARAERAEIKRAYRRLAFSLHPDVGPNPEPERFHEVHEAYEVLSNPDQRRAYDVKFVGGSQSLSANLPASSVTRGLNISLRAKEYTRTVMG